MPLCHVDKYSPNTKAFDRQRARLAIDKSLHRMLCSGEEYIRTSPSKLWQLHGAWFFITIELLAQVHSMSSTVCRRGLTARLGIVQSCMDVLACATRHQFVWAVGRRITQLYHYFRKVSTAIMYTTWEFRFVYCCWHSISALWYVSGAQQQMSITMKLTLLEKNP